jgi:hypothetical protein
MVAVTLSVTWIKSCVGAYLTYRYLSFLDVNLFLTRQSGSLVVSLNFCIAVLVNLCYFHLNPRIVE